MKAVALAASFFAFVFSLDAEITATLNRHPSGWIEFTVRNDSTVALEAFAIGTLYTLSWDRPHRGGTEKKDAVLRVYVDSIVDPSAKPLTPKEERTVQPERFILQKESGSDFVAQPIVTAGIFADGTTIGDPALLSWLIARRSNMLLAVETALETLAEAGRRNVPRAQLIEQFKKMADSVHRWYLPSEQRIGHGIYQSIVGKLINLPQGEPGSPFPPIAFVEAETAILRQRRVALLESQPSLADATLIGLGLSERQR